MTLPGCRRSAPAALAFVALCAAALVGGCGGTTNGFATAAERPGDRSRVLRAERVLVLADGRVLVGGVSERRRGGADAASCDGELAVVRLDARGKPDPGFGDGGRARIRARGKGCVLSVNRLVEDPDGRTLAGVTIFSPSESVMEDNSSRAGGLLRLTSRGRVDDGFKSQLSGFRFGVAPDGSIFDESGARYLGDGGGDPRDDHTRVRVAVDLPVDVAAQPDGKKLFLGLQNRANYRRLAVQRFDGDWQPDTTFGTHGTATADVAPGKRLVGQPELRGVLPAPDGRVIAFGLAVGSERSYTFAVKFDATGHLDRSFGDRGRIAIGPPSATREVQDLAVQPDGSLIAIGFSGPERGRGLFVARYNADGTPDRQFGRTGEVRLGLVRAPKNVNARELNADHRDGAIASGPDGTIVGVESLTGLSGSTSRSVAFRLRPDGTLDPSFGRRGIKRLQGLG